MKPKIIVFLLILFMLPTCASAVQFMAGKSLFYTQIAQGYAPGQLGFALYGRAYAKPLTERDIRNNIAAFSGSFGISRYFELGAVQVLYQDINYNLQEYGENSQFPGYTEAYIKASNFSFKLGQKVFFYGFMASFTKQGKYYNVYLEPYYDYGIAGRLMFLLSYYTNPFFPEESAAIHFNLGYTNYNDSEKIGKSGQAIPVSLAYVRSNLRTEYSFEVHGNFFTTPPYNAAFSRENYVYLCPGFKYKIYLGLHIGASLDILVYSADEQSENQYTPFTNTGYPQYPEWRLNVKVDFMPSTAFYEINTLGKVDKESITKESLRSRRIITDKKSLFEWVVDENMGAEYIDLELEQIREERKRAEEELEKLKKEIEEKSGK